MTDEDRRRADRLARALGVASLGLGIAPLTASDVISRLCGVDDSRSARTMVRLVGLREWVHAVLLLGSRTPGPLVWTRVAGDAMDLSALGLAASNRRGHRRARILAVTAGVVGITVVDVYAALRGTRRRKPEGARAGTVHAAITVNRPRDEVYRFWRDLENLPQFMIHLDTVRDLGDGRSHWRATGPLGRTLEWEAEIIDDRPDELIAWHATEGMIAGNSGAVRFTDAPGDRGTEVRVTLHYAPRGGGAATAFTRLLGEHPDQMVRDDLRRFKQVMETGEVVRSEGTPEGTRTTRQLRQRPAQPLARGGFR
ncbi:SRPBCC family protein [Actinoallomurus soli]|uniref:SRPBCC family protein n=1 Tax=Actinoallomurus soli TaxID=2952535 RepID=UPI0020939AF1|nr:SRPBCC family protein [Actinoallomurus soli]MCO5967719.1 SRPBCC family protein [Actinoallomurus soli]